MLYVFYVLASSYDRYVYIIIYIVGNGFKLFRMFGDRSDKDNLQDRSFSAVGPISSQIGDGMDMS